MTVSFTGLAAHRNPADFELRAANGTFDVDYLKAFAQAHEAAGFDRVLIGYGSTSPDGLHLGTYVTAVTERLGVPCRLCRVRPAVHRQSRSPRALSPARTGAQSARRGNLAQWRRTRLRR